jgi:hypothetical protein
MGIVAALSGLVGLLVPVPGGFLTIFTLILGAGAMGFGLACRAKRRLAAALERSGVGLYGYAVLRRVGKDSRGLPQVELRLRDARYLASLPGPKHLQGLWLKGSVEGALQSFVLVPAPPNAPPRVQRKSVLVRLSGTPFVGTKEYPRWFTLAPASPHPEAAPTWGTRSPVIRAGLVAGLIVAALAVLLMLLGSANAQATWSGSGYLTESISTTDTQGNPCTYTMQGDFSIYLTGEPGGSYTGTVSGSITGGGCGVASFSTPLSYPMDGTMQQACSAIDQSYSASEDLSGGTSVDVSYSANQLSFSASGPDFTVNGDFSGSGDLFTGDCTPTIAATATGTLLGGAGAVSAVTSSAGAGGSAGGVAGAGSFSAPVEYVNSVGSGFGGPEGIWGGYGTNEALNVTQAVDGTQTYTDLSGQPVLRWGWNGNSQCWSYWQNGQWNQIPGTQSTIVPDSGTQTAMTVEQPASVGTSGPSSPPSLVQGGGGQPLTGTGSGYAPSPASAPAPAPSTFSPTQPPAHHFHHLHVPHGREAPRTPARTPADPFTSPTHTAYGSPTAPGTGGPSLGTTTAPAGPSNPPPGWTFVRAVGGALTLAPLSSSGTEPRLPTPPPDPPRGPNQADVYGRVTLAQNPLCPDHQRPCVSQNNPAWAGAWDWWCGQGHWPWD